jgi:hypothetical protein
VRMTRAFIACAAAVVAIWACTVNTKTDKLACSVQTDCSGGRVCEAGYCVVDPNAKLDAAIDAKPIDAAVCPTTCDSCDFASGTCMIAGVGSAVSCPAGWHCTIMCGTAGACGDITCTSAVACNVTCATEGACGNVTCGGAACTIGCTAQGSGSGSGSGSAATACGTITCGPGACAVTCTGSGACGDTSCAASCRCDVSCNPLTGACGPMSCPTATGQMKHCTNGGVAGNPCNSNTFPQCHSC